jgi:hypothetical protein
MSTMSFASIRARRNPCGHERERQRRRLLVAQPFRFRHEVVLVEREILGVRTHERARVETPDPESAFTDVFLAIHAAKALAARNESRAVRAQYEKVL